MPKKFLIPQALTKVDRKAIAAKMQKATDIVTAKINSKGPKIFRGALAHVWGSNPKTRKYAPLVEKLKSEIRPLGKSHVGAGLKLRIENDKLQIRLMLSPESFGRYAYWTLYTAEYGRKALPERTFGQPYALAIKPEKLWPSRVRGAVYTHRERGMPYVVVFATKVGPVKPWFHWRARAKRLAVRRFIKEMNAL